METNVEARSASFLLFFMAAALSPGLQRDRRRRNDGDLRRVDSLNGGGVFGRHRCGLRRHAGEMRGVFDGLDG